MFKLRRFLKDYKLQLTIGPFFKLLEAVLELIVPLVMAQIIDVGIKNGDKNYILSHGGIMLLLGAVGLCSALICQYSASIASQGFGTKLRTELYKHINTLSLRELDQIGTASLITRLTSDINALQLAVAMLIRLVIRAPFLVIGAMIMAMTVDLKLSVIFIAAAVLIALILRFIMKKSVPYFKRLQKKLDLISLVSRENLEGARVVRAFSKQEKECRKMDEATESLAKTAVRVGKLSALLNPLTYAVTNLAVVCIVRFGAGEVYAGTLSQGSIIALVNYMTQITLAMVVLSNLVVIFTKASASAERINAVFELQSGMSEGEKDISPCGEYALELENVSFAYNCDKPVLKNISFKLKKGETLGIIGSTGSGKTTLIQLAAGFYDPQSGTVRLFGENIKNLKNSAIRHCINIVPQRAALLSGTVRSNLTLLNRSADPDELWNALEIAMADGFVKELPSKLDAPVAQGGKNFSGGQRQRLTIARAVAGGGDILIFDDSFSALDNKTQAEIKRMISNRLADKTKIIVSQRASAIRDADKILVISNGEILSCGTHNELLKSCGEYYEICKSQDCAEATA